jgi:cytochrome c-type biogenesis protein CcmH/NrfG
MVDEHYSQGLRLYRQEKLAEAIGEWRVVLEFDPQHANARRNIEQAEKLLRSLDERRRR